MTFVLANRETGLLAAHDCVGEHDGRFTDSLASAKQFQSYGEASDYSQNFDDTWQPEEL